MAERSGRWWRTRGISKRSLMNDGIVGASHECVKVEEGDHKSNKRIQELETELKSKRLALMQTKDLIRQAQSRNMKLLKMLENDQSVEIEQTEPDEIRSESLNSKFRQSRRILKEMQTKCDRIIGGKYVSGTRARVCPNSRTHMRAALDRELFGSGRIGMEFATRLDRNFMPKHAAYFDESSSSCEDV